MERRVLITFVGFTVLLSLAYAGLVILVAYVTEDEIVKQLMRDELRYMQSVDASGDTVTVPRLPYMRYYADLNAAPPAVAQALRENPDREEVFTDDATHYHVRAVRVAGAPTGFLVADASLLLVVTNMSTELLTLLGSTLLVMLGLAALLAWRLARYFTRPVTQLTQQVQALDQDDSRLLEVSVAHRDDEIGYLARTIESSVNGLTAALARESAFTRDVSHELRTPLTVLGNTLTLLESRAPSPDDLDTLRRAADQIGATVDVLLALARQASLTRADLALRPLLEETLLTLDAARADSDFAVTLTVPSQAGIRTNAELFALLVTNLVQNARRYAAEPRMTISLEGDDLAFCNKTATAPPPQPAAPGRRGADSPGIGQGLYLVQRIAEAMGGSLTTRHESETFCAIVRISR